ncbi:DUF1294 domain-containing protein [Parahaliea maris]|uniref:DUF1294 domain-containing protein n=1 Tax=Parahaliea maris TaxID=2716870 RepID=A0A5C8ZT88_9GAMM|nr:DUF1294 domain-containing protein [Parahaliea maris]
MRQKGKIRSWNDQKGFGFITPEDGGKDVFMHVSAVRRRGRRPVVGEIASYDLGTDNRGRPRAANVLLPGDRLKPAQGTKGRTVAVVVAIVFLCAISAAVVVGKLPALILWAYIGLSIITFFVYAFDKVAAKDGAWRTSEGTLHGLSLFGGWPGALVAQQFLRHKSKKQSFRSMFFVTVVLNLGMLAGMSTEVGRDVFGSWLGLSNSSDRPFGRATIEWSDQ